VHGEKYDYSKINYISAHDKIIIICLEHDEFEQEASSHLNGYGCRKCNNNKMRMSLNNFIEKAEKIHNNKYDYSKVDYITTETKIIIICLFHGDFEQTPHSHLNGHGCPKCSGHYMNTEIFREKAKAIHGDKYDYSKANYVNKNTKLTIICPEHGEFKQVVGSHIRGIGCPYCGGNRLFNLMPFDNLKKLVRSLKIKTQQQYYLWWINNKEYCKNNGIPYNPPEHYKTNK
jgi:DNA-directed RNA polymerase subunit RPC12/RpoP